MTLALDVDGMFRLSLKCRGLLFTKQCVISSKGMVVS